MMLPGGLRLEHPEALWLLLAVPALAAFLAARARARRRDLERFGDSTLLARLGSPAAEPSPRLRAVLLSIAVAAAALALARPQWGSSHDRASARGVDILLAVDVSDSMDAEDLELGGKLSRIERARREITDLLARLEGDRVGLLAFSGSAVLTCPFTRDRAAVELFLQALDTELVSNEGTHLGAAIRLAVRAFERTPRTARALILLTDGEDHEGDGLAAAREAAGAGVRIYVLGIGRPEGAPLASPSAGLRRDAAGELILTRLEETGLRRIAEETGGRYARSTAGDGDLDLLYHRGIHADLTARELTARGRERRAERFQWLVALALAAVMIEAPLAIRRRRTDGNA